MATDDTATARGLGSALLGSISTAMNRYGRELRGVDVPTLIWTPLPTDERYDYQGGLLVGYADYPPADVPGVLRAWAQILALEAAPDQDVGELRFIGVVGEWNVEILGRMSDELDRSASTSPNGPAQLSATAR